MTLPLLLAGAVLVALNAYVLLGGADFGGGVWDLLARGPRQRAQRDLVTHAIGPSWEANHVWLILVIVLLFVCFPAAFVRLTVTLNIPLTLVLFGIVLRGSAFVFRSYGGGRDAVQNRWGRVFATASLITPVLLGMAFGAAASGRVVPSGREVPFLQAYIAPWTSTFSIQVGALTLVAFAYLAAVYLTVAAPDDALREDFRRRALITGVVVLLIGAPPLLATAPRWEIIAAATATAALAMWSLFTRRFQLARVAAAAQISLVLWGWALAQYPLILPPDLAIEDAAAPALTLRLVAWALGAGFVVLVPSLVYLYRVFDNSPDRPGAG
jgi:cytochrome d ubiquinol oxidase subunit II